MSVFTIFYDTLCSIQNAAHKIFYILSEHIYEKSALNFLLLLTNGIVTLASWGKKVVEVVSHQAATITMSLWLKIARKLAIF